jgi:lactoylglutathione lyase
MRFALAYTAIRVRDLDRSLAFYTNVLGMRLLDRTEAPETKGVFATLKSEASPHTLEVNWYAEDSPVAGPYREGEELDHLAFAVEDLDAALAHLEARGHPKVLGPFQSAHAQWAYVTDPDGIWIELFQSRGS